MPTAAGPIDCVVSGDGPPVLVVHGSPGGHDAGAAMAGFLADGGLRTIVVDRPGYFGTPLASGPTVDGQADLYAALLDALGIERAGVLCWSGGGPSSYRFAVRHPDRLTSLVACAAVSRRYVFTGEKGAEKLIMDTGLGRRMLQLMARYTPEKLVEATIAAEGDLTADELAARVAHIVADPDKQQFTLDIAVAANHSGPRRAGFDNDMTQFAAIESLELERIERPCLIVQGTADSDVRPEYSGFAAEQIPGSELVELAAGTHLAFWVHPDSGPVRQQAIERFRSAAG
ncbi:alpha/beta fold hydrolase [Nakamurella sp.]|uniref:alpha/beta fold hydrolase n=1 Tax=Nakamurella sp. TaxID=1869182 RepID=UPI003B3A83C8